MQSIDEGGTVKFLIILLCSVALLLTGCFGGDSPAGSSGSNDNNVDYPAVSVGTMEFLSLMPAGHIAYFVVNTEYLDIEDAFDEFVVQLDIPITDDVEDAFGFDPLNWDEWEDELSLFPGEIGFMFVSDDFMTMETYAFVLFLPTTDDDAVDDLLDDLEDSNDNLRTEYLDYGSYHTAMILCPDGDRGLLNSIEDELEEPEPLSDDSDFARLADEVDFSMVYNCAYLDFELGDDFPIISRARILSAVTVDDGMIKTVRIIDENNSLITLFAGNSELLMGLAFQHVSSSVQDEAKVAACRAQMGSIATGEAMYYTRPGHNYATLAGLNSSRILQGCEEWRCPEAAYAPYELTADNSIYNEETYLLRCPFHDNGETSPHGWIQTGVKSWSSWD